MTAATGLPASIRVLERGWLSSNNILFIGREETAIVDTGYATHSAQTLALVEAALGERALDRILNTHLHSDHCGGNAILQARWPKALTAIPPGEAPQVRAWDEERLDYRALGQQCPRFGFEELLEPGHEVMLGDQSWQIHAAKGHDPHSVILFEPQSRTLISADALWEKGFGVVFPELAGEPSFEEVAGTLDLIESLAPLQVIPGHGRVFDQPSLALAAARSRLDSFVQNPQRHARHALKVLLKFKLLELQRISRADWDAWVSTTPYLEAIRTRFFESDSAAHLGAELLGELIAGGLAATEGDELANR